MDIKIGLNATLIVLIGYIFLNPIFGHIADRSSPKIVMTVSAVCVIPLSFVGFYLINKQYLMGQFFLILSASSFGAPIYTLINKFFLEKNRSRNINLFFMTGTAIGSLVPVISGYLVGKFQIKFIPIILLSVLGFCTFLVFYVFLFNNESKFFVSTVSK